MHRIESRQDLINTKIITVPQVSIPYIVRSTEMAKKIRTGTEQHVQLPYVNVYLFLFCFLSDTELVKYEVDLYSVSVSVMQSEKMNRL